MTEGSGTQKLAPLKDADSSSVLPMPFNDLVPSAQFVVDASGVQLVGSVCLDCGRRMLGERYACSACVSTNIDSIEIGPRGSLYSYTTIHVSPNADQPYVLGYVDFEGAVDLDDGVRALAIVSAQPDELYCDQGVELVRAGDDWAVKPI